MFLSHLFYGLLVALVFSTRVSVVLKDILFLHFKGSNLLLGESFLVLQLILLSFEILVRLSSFSKFLVDEFVLTSQCLDVLSELRAFSLLDIYDLGLVVDLLSEGLVFLPKKFDFVFSLE